MNVINFGYIIPFVTTSPTPKNMENNRSALQHSDFVEKTIKELLDNNCITEVTCPFVVNPLTVSVNSSEKERMVLDLRHVNTFVDKQKVKFEGVKEMMTFINSSGYGFKFDLKSGYHLIEIHSNYQKYLGFSWKFGEQVKYFTFSVLGFGTSSNNRMVRFCMEFKRLYFRNAR